MRKLGEIKLNRFSKTELDRRALNALKGGCACESECFSGTCSKNNPEIGRDMTLEGRLEMYRLELSY